MMAAEIAGFASTPAAKTCRVGHMRSIRIGGAIT